MRRFASVLVSVLLGAFAVAVGMGVFLKKANDDRTRLADIAVQAEEASRQARLAREQAVQEANKKLDAANTEITKAQALIKSLQEERDLMAQALVLPKPSARQTKNWNEIANLPLGVTVQFPTGSTVEVNDQTALTLASAAATTSTAPSPDSRWFSLTPYDERLEQELLMNLSSSTPVSYLVDGHLLIGQRGRRNSLNEDFIVLRVRSNGNITHLLWARDPLKKPDGSTIITTIASFDFAT